MAIAWGEDPFAPLLPAPGGRTPRQAIEAAILPHLERTPCVVTFSGGRDSSSVLALAVHVARREGLPLPIPVTNRFPGAEGTDEDEWQELVVAHLGLEDWVRLDWTDELDMLGPYGLRVLRRHGSLMPHNAHFLEPALDRAEGGSMLTGVGGDEVLGPRFRALVAHLLYRRRRPRVRALPQFARELAPRRLRRRAERRSLPIDGFQWLKPDVRRNIAESYAADAVAWPLGWDGALRRYWRGRHVQCVLATLNALGDDHDVRVGSPFVDPAFLSDYAAAMGPAGPPGRARGLIDLLGDLLPERVLRRTTKASFDVPFWNRHTRAFLEGWTGAGVDDRLVDVEGLRREWAGERPAGNCYTLLQHAWLADAPRDGGGLGAESFDQALGALPHRVEPAWSAQAPDG